MPGAQRRGPFWRGGAGWGRHAVQAALSPAGVPSCPPEIARMHFVSWKEAQCTLSLLQTSLPLSTLTPGSSYARPEVTGPGPSQLARKGPWLCRPGKIHSMQATGVSPPGVGLFSAQESSVCWAGWSTSLWAHLCIGGTRPCGACHLCVLPLPERAAGWLVWKGRRCGRFWVRCFHQLCVHTRDLAGEHEGGSGRHLNLRLGSEGEG